MLPAPIFPRLILLVFGMLAAFPVPSVSQPGQQAADSLPTQERATPPAPPRAFQIPARARILADSAMQAEQTIQRLADMGGILSEIEDAERRHEELLALLESIVETEFVRLERLSRLRDQALLENSRLEGIRGRLMARLAGLGEVHADWTERLRVWRSWLEALREESEFAEAEVTAAVERIEDVVLSAAGAAGEPIALQGRVEDLQSEIERVGAIVTTIRTARRQALLDRSQPVLFSADHRAELVEEGWRAWDPTAGIEPAAYAAFLRGHVGLVGFHALLAVLIGLLVRWLRPSLGGKHEWRGLLEDPWALGLLVSVVFAMMRITLAPPLWDVFLWALFGSTAAVLSQHLFAARALRLTVYLLAAFFPIFLLLEVAQLPEAVLRVGLAAVAAVAAPVFLMLARERDAARGPGPEAPTAPAQDASTGAERGTSSAPAPDASGRPEPRDSTDTEIGTSTGWGDAGRWPLRVGAAIWIVVLLAVFTGFDALSRWLVHSTVMSAAVVFVLALAFAFVRASAVTFSRIAGGGSILRRAGVLLGQRVIVLLRPALVVAGALVLLDVWGISESPVATWQRIMDAGVSVGALRLTIGRLLLGALVVYLAMLLSALVRSFMEGDVRPTRPGFQGPSRDQGLGASISRLAHYALITLGVILALGVMGLELQNFAIVAGALGIGVGFGLQNVVNNFASGLILLFERPVRVGDTVVVGDVWGTIQKIGLRSTIMVTLDQSEMIVPNADLVSEKVINWTLTSPISRIILPVGVAYGSPTADVLEILEQSAFAHHSVLKDPPPEALFIGFGDSSLDFELRVWVENIRLRLQTRSAVLTDVERRLREASIEIPFPQRDLHLRSVERDVLKKFSHGS